MLFSKLFGSRRAQEDTDDAPTAAPPKVVPKLVAKPVARVPANAGTETKLNLQDAAPGEESRGFDPYNSGAFKRSNAWERINRR